MPLPLSSCPTTNQPRIALPKRAGRLSPADAKNAFAYGHRTRTWNGRNWGGSRQATKRCSHFGREWLSLVGKRQSAFGAKWRLVAAIGDNVKHQHCWSPDHQDDGRRREDTEPMIGSASAAKHDYTVSNDARGQQAIYRHQAWDFECCHKSGYQPDVCHFEHTQHHCSRGNPSLHGRSEIITVGHTPEPLLWQNVVAYSASAIRPLETRGERQFLGACRPAGPAQRRRHPHRALASRRFYKGRNA
jgi:hypothetical protein